MKNYKKVSCENNTYTSNFNDLDKSTGNIYQSLVAIAKRSEEISVEIKEELNRKIEEFAYENDSLEEIFENNEQIEVSKFYERLPKPTLIALDEWKKGQLNISKE